MTSGPFDPREFLSSRGFAPGEIAELSRSLSRLAERFRIREDLTEQEAMARLAGALGEMDTEEFVRVFQLPGDIGTDEPPDLELDEAEAEEAGFGDIGTDEP